MVMVSGQVLWFNTNSLVPNLMSYPFPGPSALNLKIQDNLGNFGLLRLVSETVQKQVISTNEANISRLFDVLCLLSPTASLK